MTVNIIWFAVIVLLLAVVGAVSAFALRRKGKAYILVIEKDYRNAANPPRKYYCIVDRPAKALRLYKSLLSFKQTKNIPMFDVNAFADGFKKIRCVQGVTGNPQDDMVVPIAQNIMSQAAALEYANKVSDGIILGLTAILNSNPVVIDGKVNMNELTTKVAETFNKKWVMQKLGVAEVQNSNIITLAQKMFVASLATRANEFITERAGFLEKHGSLIMLGIIMVMVGITSYIILTGVSSFLTNLNNLVHSSITVYEALHVGVNTSSALPAIPKVTT